MKITIQYNDARSICKGNADLTEFLRYQGGYGFRQFLDEKKEDKEDQTVSISLPDVSKKNLSLLLAALVKHKASGKTIKTIELWMRSLDNPNEATVTSLQHFEKLLIAAIKQNKKKWVAIQNDDGMLVPCAVKDVKYYPRRQDDYAHVSMTVVSVILKKNGRWDDEDGAIKKTTETDYHYFYAADVGLIPGVLFDDEDNDFDDDDDEPKVKRKAKPKHTGKTLSEILRSQGIVLLSDSDLQDHEEQLQRAYAVRREIGKTLTATTKVYVMPDTKNGYSAWSDVNVDKVCKLVVDTIQQSDATNVVSGGAFGEVAVPEHPYVLTYNISNYAYAVVHVDSLVEYKYNSKVIDSLILHPSKKQVLSKLIGGENNFTDIISGKSGGIIILSSGEAGTGKTLTAEVYSELMKKPLYCIQSSQLGISVDTLEENLNKILIRANRWGAILLIDEADAYIYQRGNDIHQNCVVGTFLRLLEYYNGVMFLTSNRPDIIDDAIMSRVTLHIKYTKPTPDEFAQLWDVLGTSMNLIIPKELPKQLLQRYEMMSGRDVRNTLKNIKKCYPTATKVSMDFIVELEQFLPFIKLRGDGK